MTKTRASRNDLAILLGIAAVVALVHMLTNDRYGFHRDELQFLSDARHLDWGYVAYPPLTPFLEHIGLALFGISETWLRLFSVIAQSAALVATGLMARELGGGRLAQVTATVSVALSALPLFEGTEFQYSSFDYLWWVLIAYFLIRLLKTENPRWWIAIGAVIGLGLLTKYSITFYIAGLLAGLVFTQSRRFLLAPGFWGGVAVALLLFLPNFLWQVHHGFISYHFLQSIHARDVRNGRADGFLFDQIKINANLIATPLWIAGLIFFLRDRRYRMLGILYLVPLALFFIAKGRGYYVAAAYPMLLAMGSVAVERWLGTLTRMSRLAIEATYFTLAGAVGIAICCLILPLANSGPLKAWALKNNDDLREEFGWEEMAWTVAGIRSALPPEQREHVGIITGNYGEQGAIEILGAKYGLPTPIGGTNSAWLRGYPTPQPTILIVVGFSYKQADETFSACREAGRNGNAAGIPNEESKLHPVLFLCGPPIKPWPEFWQDFQSFG
ncbi:Dolichyl-phosphate-mannose-protein mannosyltransferase [Granulicella pectinivorans]|uniref:Dolichyl-phosphate-mannose-protein mannosyltransferase n=1 Tax=Granulicella pectinivorans TaxID=474950 RepID=A0A1I6N1D2_9BACT|nr:glycosyltransferase family 39 protein [Granulicella pectinivorans]SFS21763.1 Dolichyl-phosphate-mannose-protein mannosyltransferase [Granulicella pectinivorans]